MKTLFTFSFIFLLHFTVLSQTQRDINRSKSELNTPLHEQFNTLLELGKDYTTDSIPFEVIKRRYLLAFKEHLNDSLKITSAAIRNSKKEINLIKESLKTTKQENKNLKKTLLEQSKRNNTVYFLGAYINKTLFFVIDYMLLILLVIGIVFLFKRYISSTAVESKLKADIEALENTIEENRKKRLYNELKLKREILELEKQLPKK